MNPEIRYPAVAEAFYPADTRELENLITALLHQAESGYEKKSRIRAIVTPHSGYLYSGAIAACAYKAINGRSFKTVFLMGNAHAYLFEGIALDTHKAWHSPLGNVPVNTALNRKLLQRAPELAREMDIAHHSDHTLEVQLPFLLRTLKPGFSILPMLFGENSGDIHQKTADLLLSLLEDDDLLVVSTDLSHYPAYRDANTIDRMTLEHVVSGNMEGLEEHERRTLNRGNSGEISLFCSPDALKTLLVMAGKLGWQAEKLCYNNSGEGPCDDKMSVVGFGTVIFFEP